MMNKWGFLLVTAVIFLTSCNNDDDSVDELPQEEQNQVDDEAIVQYLEDHYFDPVRGLIKKYDEEVEEDDDYPNLFSQGTKLSSGVWVIKRDGYLAEGPVADDNDQDSILISYDSKYFIADNRDLEEGETLYGNLVNFYNTIYSSGTPSWDPVFYHYELTDTEIEGGIQEYETVIKGFLEGLSHFNSTNTDGTDVYDFQGAIIVPSREAYGRDYFYLSSTRSYTFRNCSFMFNFELHKVIPRED